MSHTCQCPREVLEENLVEIRHKFLISISVGNLACWMAGRRVSSLLHYIQVKKNLFLLICNCKCFELYSMFKIERNTNKAKILPFQYIQTKLLKILT